MDFTYFKKYASQNGTNGTRDTSAFFHENLHFTAPYTFLMVLGSTVGIMGNTMVMVGILTNKKLKKLENALLFNLAVADMVVTGFVDPLLVLGAIKGEFYFFDKPILCASIAELCLISCFTSCFSIAAASFDRFIHICYRQLYPKIFTKKSVAVLIVGLWLLAIGLTLPHQFGWGGHTYDKKNLGCVWDRTADFGYTLMFSVALFIVLIVVALASFHTFYYLARKRRLIKYFKPLVIGMGYTKRVDIEQRKKEYADSVMYAKTVFILFTTFTLCWTPYAIIVSADRKDEWPLELHLFAIMLAHNNSCLNCVIYPLAHTYFREAYRQMAYTIFPCCACLRPKPDKSIEMNLGESAEQKKELLSNVEFESKK